MDALIAPNGKRRAHRCSTLTQAVDLQQMMHQAALRLATDFRQASTVAERKELLPHLAKATDAWSKATDARREVLGRARAGQLSPAERAEMRRRKSSGSKQRAPKLAPPAEPKPSAPVVAPHNSP